MKRWLLVGGVLLFVVFACAVATTPPRPASPNAPAAAGVAVSDQAKAEATDLLGAAVSNREQGELGLALELGRQALGKWPDNAEARSFVATVYPQATAQARTAIEQATTQARTAATAQAAAQVQAAEAARIEASLGRVGRRIESGGIALTANGVTRTNQLSQFTRAGEGKTYLVVDVTVENVTRDKAPYNPIYFRVKDVDGFEYNASFMGGDQGLKSGELAKGERSRGTVPFEIPAAARGLVMSYQPIVLFGGYQTIRFALD